MISSASPSSRKRMLSLADDTEEYDRRRLRRRIGSMAELHGSSLLGLSPLRHPSFEQIPNTHPFLEDEATRARSRPLSSSSSYSLLGIVPGSKAPSSIGSDFRNDPGVALMRRASSQSLVGTSTVPPFPELSAKYHLRNTKTTIDFSLPPAPEGESPLPLALSAQNVLYFSRANRIQFKNLNTSEDIGQLCKLQNGIGDLKIIECGGIEKVDHIALASTKGTIQIWDVRTKKILSNWSTKGVAAMKWNGCLLTIGSAKGTIRYYDTRISPASKMKEQARKMTRHQSCITNLAWNPEGKLLASADDTGTIYCWDHRQKVPLDVGEFVQRRKKMQHAAAVSALSWCPWQAKVLASGDKAGTIRLWNIDASNSGTNAIIPGKVETVSSVVSLHFSPQCKEFIAVHGSGPVVTEPVQRLENAISVYSYPGLRDVITLPVSDKSVAGSVMNNAGTKVVLAVPEENKLKVWDAWGKNKELRRQSSFMSASVIR